MEDPSYNVPPALLEHVHLISSNRFPSTQQSLPLDNIVDLLISAPQIVRDRAAVSWQYIRPPPNGTIFLAWQPQSQLQDNFATDGYLWPEPEQQLQKQHRGYSLQIFIADSGYNPGAEPIASHRRVRYRLNGSHSGEAVDTHLEIVHYTRGPPEKHIPVRNLPINNQQNRLQKSRQYLESAGSLERKEFMLSDRSNWPKITMPGQRTPSMPPRYGGRPSVPGMPNPGRGSGSGIDTSHLAAMGNAAQARLRAMQNAPANRPTRSGTHDFSHGESEMLDEDATIMGDALDQIRPRDVSLMRYQQHQEWMEEVLSSPYSTGQINPHPLSFYCPPGELADVLEGLCPRNPDTGVLDVSKMTEEGCKEMEERMEAYKAKMHKDMDGMRVQHEVDKRNVVQGSRKWVSLVDEIDNLPDGADLSKYIEIAESECGVKIGDDGDAGYVLVQKAGLLNKEELVALNQKLNGGNGGPNQQQDEFNEFTNIDSAGEALDFYSGDLGGYDADQGMTFIGDETGEEYT